MEHKFKSQNLLTGFLIFFVCLLQNTGFCEENCSMAEMKAFRSCRKEITNPNPQDYKSMCCNMVLIENCVLNSVPEKCTHSFIERYSNDAVKRTICKDHLKKCAFNENKSETLLASSSTESTFNRRPVYDERIPTEETAIQSDSSAVKSDETNSVADNFIQFTTLSMIFACSLSVFALNFHQIN